MLIDDGLYRGTQIGIILAIPALLLIWAIWKGRFKLGIGAALAVLFAVTLACSIFTANQSTIVLQIESPEQISKAVAIASTRYRFSNGSETAVTAAGRRVTLIINNTDQLMAVMPVTYSFGGFAPQDDKPDLTIAPFSAATSPRDIEYYGQADHAPPRTVEAVGPQTARYWLTEAPH